MMVFVVNGMPLRLYSDVWLVQKERRFGDTGPRRGFSWVCVEGSKPNAFWCLELKF